MFQLLVVTIYILLFLVLLGVIFVFCLLFIGMCVTDVFFIPVPQKIAERVSILSGLLPNEFFYDLGSGEGRVVRSVAKKYPRSNVIGIEKAPLPFLLGYIFTPQKKFPNVQLTKNDFNALTFENASCVFLYLSPKTTNTLEHKLKKELPLGARVISCDFPFTDWKLESSEKIDVHSQVHTLYLYKKSK